jgi:putative ABC transport system ATP-binding protein
MSVMENIEIPLFYQGWNERDSQQRAAELADIVGLAKRLNHRPSELSGGEQQRVAIARSLANEPLILLADEPTGNLDSKTGKEIMTLLKNLNKQGKTIIMVTHDPKVAMQAHRLIRLLDGNVVEDSRQEAKEQEEEL